MMYWDFPGVGQGDRVDRSEAIDVGKIRLSPEKPSPSSAATARLAECSWLCSTGVPCTASQSEGAVGGVAGEDEAVGLLRDRAQPAEPPVARADVRGVEELAPAQTLARSPIRRSRDAQADSEEVLAAAGEAGAVRTLGTSTTTIESFRWSQMRLGPRT
jgi:hypothetical protein